MVSTLYKCFHCAAFYELKSRAIKCAKEDLGDKLNVEGYKPIVSRYKGCIKRR